MRKPILAILALILASLSCGQYVTPGADQTAPGGIQTDTETPSPPAVSTRTPTRAATKTPQDVTVYIVTAYVLEVRNGPGEESTNIGYLKLGDLVRVYGTHKTTLEKCSVWARIGVKRWVCMDRLAKVKK